MANPQAPAEAVANTFVKRYTEVLEEDPAKLICFFRDESTFLHGVEGDDTPVAHGIDAIQKRIKAIDFSDSTFLVTHVDGQNTIGSSYLVTVLGTLRHASDSRPFVQTFVLAPQEVGYYVHNYVFRSFHEAHEAEGKHEGKRGKGKSKGQKAEPAAAAPSADGAAAPAAAAPIAAPAVSPATEHKPATTAPATPAAVTSATPAPAHAHLTHDHNKPHEHNKAHAHEHKTHDAASAAPAPSAPSAAPAAKGTFSYAAAVAVPGKPAPAPATKPAPKAPRTETQKPAAASASPTAAPANAKKEGASALCVKNIPFTATEEQVKEVLNQHAKVKALAMKKGFAFLDLDSEDAVQKLLDYSSANPILLSDRILKIERRVGEGPTTRKEGKESKERAERGGRGGGGAGRK